MQAQKILAVSSLLTAAMFSASAYAGGDSGFYIGAGLGQASIDETLDGGEGFGSINFDGDDTAYKLIAGYNFGIVPLVDLGVEFEYLDFGEPSEQILGSEAEIDATALALFGIAGVNLGPVGVFGKIGMAGWDGSSSVNGIEVASDNGSDPAYGVGVRFHLASFQIRAEYEVFEVSDVDVDLLSASLLYTF
jgi:opacity protein-like surface antigen